MKLFAAVLFTGLSLAAAPLVCPPDFAHDGVRVDPGCPGIGATVFANPGTTWLIALNDDSHKPNHGDNDFNDMFLSAKFVGDGMTLTFLGALSDWDSVVFTQGVPVFTTNATVGAASVLPLLADGSAVNFRFFTLNTGLWTESGSAGVYVSCLDCGRQTTETPEPSSFALLGLGLVVAGVRRRRG